MLKVRLPNGYANFSTDGGALGKKLPDKQEQSGTIVKGGSSNQVNDTRIIGTLAKYLWMKDNLEFRLRVIAALGLLVGAKVCFF